MTRVWLSIIGIGEDGADGLSPAANRLLKEARLVVGGARHLALVESLGAERLSWPSPMEMAYPLISARRGEPVCVLASGDPFFYGVGSALMRFVDPSEMTCLPAPSAFSLTAARLGWSQQDCALLSLHGRPLARLVPHLHDRARILALSWDGSTPKAVAGLLTARGFADSFMAICESLGGPNERLRRTRAGAFDLEDVGALSVVALDVIAGVGARVLPRAPGLPDDWFEHDGQITKREVRAWVISTLAPRRGQLLWDIGAGSGSVAIEWMLADPANRAIAIEQDATRAARILRNAQALGAPDLHVIGRPAPEALRDLQPPDAIFVGGGATTPGLLDAAIAASKPGCRLVVNAVTIETQSELARRFEALGGELTQIQVSHADVVGGFHAMRPTLPILQWSYVKS
jgi:precorrin-6B C5,15-methyltransferase / cobalt-precorrin-6B C5,C15-methyltransferase